MKRTTVKISDELDGRLRHHAALRGVTVSELTRDAIAHYLGPPAPEDGRVRRLGAAGCWDSGEPDLAHRIEEILYGIPGPES